MLFHPLRVARVAPALTLAALCVGGAAQAEKPAFAPVAPPPLISAVPPAAQPPAAAVQAAAPAPAPAAASAVERGSAAQAANTSVSSEAGVRTTVIEDGGTRIEELKVRGNVRSIHVAPKGVGAGMAYEVLPQVGPGGPRDTAPGPGSTHSSAGQRVWSLFSF